MTQRKTLDESVAETLAAWSQQLSRRGVLAKIGEFALKVTGLVMLPVLPVDRAYAGSCAEWKFCGMYGRFCASCCGSGASDYSCPSCTTVGASWSRCCYDPSTCTNKMITYKDCCGGPNSSASACAGGGCYNHPSQQPVWCGGAPLPYRCTVISVGANC